MLRSDHASTGAVYVILAQLIVEDLENGASFTGIGSRCGTLRVSLQFVDRANSKCLISRRRSVPSDCVDLARSHDLMMARSAARFPSKRELPTLPPAS